MNRLPHKIIVSTGVTAISLWIFDMGVAGILVTFVSTFVTV